MLYKTVNYHQEVASTYWKGNPYRYFKLFPLLLSRLVSLHLICSNLGLVLFTCLTLTMNFIGALLDQDHRLHYSSLPDLNDKLRFDPLG